MLKTVSKKRFNALLQSTDYVECQWISDHTDKIRIDCVKKRGEIKNLVTTLYNINKAFGMTTKE